MREYKGYFAGGVGEFIDNTEPRIRGRKEEEFK